MAEEAREVKARGLVVLEARAAGRANGRVALVGAGPGDPELLTLKAARLISQADVIVHDGLVSQAILDLAPARARRISVAKRRSHHSVSQPDIERMLVAFAREGLFVVRLKGGDPFMFGRGGEELAACREAGVPCDVVPGVTAALAAAASSGAPLTHRGAAQAVTFVTGHGRDDAAPDLDWTALSTPNQTVAIYMGLATAAATSQRLMAQGRDASTPVAVVENASLPSERRIVTTLGSLAQAVEGLKGPALLLIGEAMALAQSTPDAAGELAAATAAPVRQEARR